MNLVFSGISSGVGMLIFFFFLALLCWPVNVMGIVWDRWYWHRNDLNQSIADFVSWRKPTLTVVDAYNVMKQNGPRGVSMGDVVTMKSLVVSTDPVAADAAAALIFGSQPSDVRHIQLAADMGLGKINLKELAIDRIKI